ncbi:MAG TPA: AmmeMemoRadiSam system radical SAM enzyme [Prolixibacteraceae bacterium]|nr:AmmeMemoRadiSam system radical SAM enzyme [Prolixibacteraceae bacterium]
MNEALFYSKLDDNHVQCMLCPRYCHIEPGYFGNCHARKNCDGQLISTVYGKLAAINTDPIEKKPLYHFFPGREILSVGTTGCNLHCVFCQNFKLSQYDNHYPVMIKNSTPEELANQSMAAVKNLGVAFTYNEPFVNFEFMVKASELIKQNNQHTVMVSNGYMNAEPLSILLENIDAFNIDLKAFSEKFYRKYSKATLKPVLETILKIAQSGKHLEITNLVIPTLNDEDDEFEKMCDWIANETGKNTVLHLSRFFPRYELNQYPTPVETLFHLYDVAKKKLNHVYIGNLATAIHSNTYCPTCKTMLIERTYYRVKLNAIDSDGKCTTCGTPVISHC